jgi:hypothetical protein
MNATKKVFPILIATKMKRWRDRALAPTSTRAEKICARRNYFKLVRKYARIASEEGLTETEVFSS